MLLLAGWLLLLTAAGSQASDAPLRWRWSNPRPHGGNGVDMVYSPALGVAVQVAELGQIFSSFDFNVWLPRATGTSNDLRGVTFMGARALVTGANGTVLYADSLDDFRPGILTSGVTADWLESVTAGPALAVAVGDSGAVYTSTNGIHWKRQSSGTAQWLRGVAYGGGVFMAVGEGGTILRSINGTNWAARIVGTENFNRVSFASGRFTAVGEGGACVSSINLGTNWLSEVTGASNDLFYVVSGNGTRLVVGDSEVRSQQPGGPWVNELVPDGLGRTPWPWTYYSALKTPDSFLIAGRTGLMEEGFGDTNGAPFRWVPGDDSVRNWLWDVTNPTNLYVAVGDRATILTSGNGVDWRLELPPDATTNSIFFGVGGTPNLLVVVGDKASLIVSPNVVSNIDITVTNGTNVITIPATGNAFGVLWYAMAAPTTNDLQGIAATTNLFVVTGDRGTILTSPDGTNWTLRASPTNRFLSSVTPWPGGWVVTGDDGAIVTSVDGVAWSLVPPPTTNWLYRVRYLGGKLITVGQNGTILTSTNGSAWVKQTSGTDRKSVV